MNVWMRSISQGITVGAFGAMALACGGGGDGGSDPASEVEFDDLDGNQDGVIEAAEWSMGDSIAFAEADMDGDGLVSRNEMSLALGGEALCTDTCDANTESVCNADGTASVICQVSATGCLEFADLGCADGEVCEGGVCLIPEIDPFADITSGVPAPGSVCPIPSPWGFTVGEQMQNIAYKDCNGDDVTLWDSACGAAVNWVYFTYGW